MKYLELANTFESMSKTSSRLKLINILVDLFKITPKETISKIIYLIQGKLGPNFSGIEIGIAEKLAMGAISKSSGVSINIINKKYKKIGDLGDTAFEILIKKSQKTFINEVITVERVFNTLYKISSLVGSRSQDMKMRYISSLLNDANQLEAKFLLKILLGTLRLGIADNTLLDSLAIAYTESKKNREVLENAYNVSSDLGKVAYSVATNGIKEIKKFKIVIFNPIRPMLADRVKDLNHTKNKKFCAEYKLDGERVQIHFKKNKTVLFSRSLENITNYYPDIVKNIPKYLKLNDAILEAEIVAINENNEFLPFQDLMHRRRKYKIDEAILQYPISVNFFDLLYYNGIEYTNKKYIERRKKLNEIISENGFMKIIPMIWINKKNDINKFLEKSIDSGCEGVMLKDINSSYKAGIRGSNWLKLKKEYKDDLGDSLDLVIIGAFFGKGRRTGKYGTFLLAAYDDEKDMFSSICKVGSGFTDYNLDQLYHILSNKITLKKSTKIESNINADVWIKPSLVIEIIASEITLSPIHQAAKNKIKKNTGLALRFPKFTGKIRYDKSIESASTVNEIVQIYKNQKKLNK